MIQKPNLLPPAYQPPPPVNWLRVGIITVVSTIVVVFGVISFNFYTEIKGLEAEKSALVKSIEGLPVMEKVNRITGLQVEIDYLEGRIDELDTGAVPVSVIFADITRVMPEALIYDNLDYQGESLTIDGKADTPEMVADYVIELRKFMWAKRVEITELVINENIRGIDSYSYQIEVQLRKTVQEKAVQEGGQEDAPGVSG